MPSHRDPFGAALNAIRHQLRSGRRVLGEQLMITAFAEDLRLSATPIREALSRLAGEGLIEDRRGSGYFAWRLDAVDLLELYGLAAAYVGAALRVPLPPGATRSAPDPARPLENDPHVARTEQIFGAVIRGARNFTLSRAQALLDDRLAPVRRAEPLVLSDVEPELDALWEAVNGPDRQAIEAAFAAYQARRVSAAPDLVAAMRDAGRAHPSI